MSLSDRGNKAAEAVRISNNVSLSILISLLVSATLVRKIQTMGWIALLFIVPFIMFLLWKMWRSGNLSKLLRFETLIWLSNLSVIAYFIYNFGHHMKDFTLLIYLGAPLVLPLTIDFIKEMRDGRGIL